jgi:lysophospholipase L1-like esterase
MLSAALAGCGAKVPQLPALGPGDVIVAFGDSLTYGTGATENESYPAVLEQLISRKVVRAGVPGETTSEALKRLEGVIREHRPALIIVGLGGNDLLRRVSDAEIKANLRSIIQMIRLQGISVVLFGVPSPAPFAGTAPFYEELAQEFDLPYEGSIVGDVLYSAGEKSDTIHPNAKGYRRMAEAFADLLTEAGAI